MALTPAQKKTITDHPLTTTTGSEDPRYVAFWTNEKVLQQFAQELSQDPQIADMLPLPPSSTIIVEFTPDTTDPAKLVAGLFINDKQVTMAQCTN